MTNTVRSLLAGLLLLAGTSASAFLIPYTSGGHTRSVYLMVGDDGATVNSASLAVPAGTIGTGPQVLATNSSTSVSFSDGTPRCTPATGQLYVGGYSIGPNATATLSVSSPANLVDAVTGATLPIGSLSWVSSSAVDSGSTIPGGALNGTSSQTLFSLPDHSFFDTCLTFTYANNQFAPAGTFNARITFSLSAP